MLCRIIFPDPPSGSNIDPAATTDSNSDESDADESDTEESYTEVKI